MLLRRSSVLSRNLFQPSLTQRFYTTDKKSFNIFEDAKKNAGYTTELLPNGYGNGYGNGNKKDVGLTRFMSKVYTRMGLGVASTMGVSFALMPFVGMANPFICFGVGTVASFASIYGIITLKPIYKTCYHENELIHYSENEPLREASFWGLTGGMGIMLSPFMSIMMQIDHAIVPASLLLSSTIFGGCAFYATKCKDATMMAFKAPLAIGLCSLVGMQLVGIGSMLIFGQNSFSMMVNNVDVYGGALLFTAMAAYDSYLARKLYVNGEPDHIACATNVYLDFINL